MMNVSVLLAPFLVERPRYIFNHLLRKKARGDHLSPVIVYAWEPPLKAPYITRTPDDRNRLGQIVHVQVCLSADLHTSSLTDHMKRIVSNIFNLTH